MVQQLQAKPRRAMQCKTDMLAASCSCTLGAGQEGEAAMNQQAQATAMRAVRPAAVRALQLSTQRRRTTCRTCACMHVGVLMPAAKTISWGAVSKALKAPVRPACCRGAVASCCTGGLTAKGCGSRMQLHPASCPVGQHNCVMQRSTLCAKQGHQKTLLLYGCCSAHPTLLVTSDALHQSLPIPSTPFHLRPTYL